MEFNNVYCGDCYELLGHIQSETIDVIYMDPPFLHKKHRHYLIKKVWNIRLRIHGKI